MATSKQEAPPLYKLLAANFRRRDLAFGWYNPDLDATVAQQLPTPRVPFLLVAYVDPTAAADKGGKVPILMEPYQMPMKYKFMANFLESIASRLGRGNAQVCRPHLHLHILCFSNFACVWIAYALSKVRQHTNHSNLG